jgi:cytochrome c2
MSDPRKYIIWAFLIFALVFAGIYFAMDFISIKSSPGYCGTVDDNTFINNDTSRSYKDGKTLFQNKCAACHVIHRDFTGPDLIGFTKRGPWSDRKKILAYLKDPWKFYKENRTKYIEDLYNSSPVAHPAFFLNEKEIDDLIYYLDSEEKYRKKKNPESSHFLHLHQFFIKTILRKQLVMCATFNYFPFL